MSPEERKQFNDMKRKIEQIERVEHVPFIKNLERRLNFVSGDITLNDLSDVDTSGVTNGQVIKYNSSNETWENDNDLDT